jgi:ribosome-binding protein aMBF1 (putative translation factor)
VANKNFEDKIAKEQDSTTNMVENFRWVITMARRKRHISQEQLASAIGEPDAAIKKIEEGILPKNSSPLVKKIEDYLGIRISKDVLFPTQRESLKFDSVNPKGFTISDLKEIKGNKEELSEEEINRLVFGE